MESSSTPFTLASHCFQLPTPPAHIQQQHNDSLMREKCLLLLELKNMRQQLQRACRFGELKIAKNDSMMACL
jgi:hypothetical protein